MTQLKIIVDRDLCEANGLCAQVAPKLFEIGEDDQMRVLTPQPFAADVTAAEEAVRRCPRGALSLTRA